MGKKLLILLMIAAVFTVSACNTKKSDQPTDQTTPNDSVSPSQQNTITNNETQGQEPQIEHSPEQAIQDYFQALIDSDYERSTQFLSPSRLDGITPEQFVKNVKEQHLKNSVVPKDFLITEITDFEEHKVANILIKSAIADKVESEELTALLVEIDGKWYLDFSMELNRTTIDPYISDNEHLILEDIILVEHVDGYIIELMLSNNHQIQHLGFGLNQPQIQAPLVFTLSTDSGETDIQIPYGVLQAGESAKLTLRFHEAKGTAYSLAATTFFPLNDELLPIQDVYFSIELSLE